MTGAHAPQSAVIGWSKDRPSTTNAANADRINRLWAALLTLTQNACFGENNDLEKNVMKK